jgi:hypothetical protein
MNKKTIAITLPLLFVVLLSTQACNAVVTPVKVERLKDVGFVRMRGDHNTQSFLFHYVNLSPTQEVKLFGVVTGGPKQAIVSEIFLVGTGDSLDYSINGGYGYTFDFSVEVKEYMTVKPWILITEETVIIPPA